MQLDFALIIKMYPRAKRLLELAIAKSGESNQLSGEGYEVDSLLETNAVRKETPACTLVEYENHHHQIEPGTVSDELQLYTMDEENDLNLANIVPQNTDISGPNKKRKQVEIKYVEKRLKETSGSYLVEFVPEMHVIGKEILVSNKAKDQNELGSELGVSDGLELEESLIASFTTAVTQLINPPESIPSSSPEEYDTTVALQEHAESVLGVELNQDLIKSMAEAGSNLAEIGPQDSDLTDCEDIPTNNKKSKTRKRQPEKWKKNVKKRLKNTGKSYETLKGRTVPAKKLKASCTDCRLKCTEKICEDDRLKIFNDFWGIGDLGKQRYYVSNCMEVVKPKYSLHNENSKRTLNMSYNFPINSEKIRVCKRFFSATLDIGHSFLSTVNKNKDDLSGVIAEDRRGQHGNTGRSLAQADKDGAREHINSYPRKDSHYCRASSTKEYLDGDLNLSMMYRQYKEWCHHNSKPIIKQGTYENIFRNEFNIAFHKPKKDQCSLCLSYQNAVGVDKLQLMHTYDQHLKERDMSRLEKKADIELAKNDVDKIICCYDMQAVLQTPCGNDSLFFYKRRLNVYNCTVYDILSKAAHCYLWNESLGGKGCDEVGTCIYTFLKDHCAGKHVIFYSDNCSAQNKNKYLLGLYHYSIKILGVKSITHKYLVVGHTQNEGDSVHSTIEREKARILKNGSIYVPSQWKSLIQCAKKTGTPYGVYELDYSEILDLKDLVTQFGTNFTINNDSERVVWNNIKNIYLQASSPYSVFYTDTYDSNATMKCINVRRIRGRGAGNVELHLRKKFHERPKISGLKKKIYFRYATQM